MHRASEGEYVEEEVFLDAAIHPLIIGDHYEMGFRESSFSMFCAKYQNFSTLRDIRGSIN